MNGEPSDSAPSLQPPAEREQTGMVYSGQCTADSQSLNSGLQPTAYSLQPSYSPLVADHFQHPRNAGHLPPGPGVVEAITGAVAAGAQIRLTLRFDGGRVQEARFQAYGCPHFLAAASVLTEQLPGRTREDLARYTWRDLPVELRIPVEKRGRLLILEDAVHAAAQ